MSNGFHEGPPSTGFIITFLGVPAATILLGLVLLLNHLISSRRTPKSVPFGSEKLTSHRKSSKKPPVQFVVSGPEAVLAPQVDIPAVRLLNKAFVIAQLVSSQPMPREDGSYVVDHRWHALSSSSHPRIDDLRVELWDSPPDEPASQSATGNHLSRSLPLRMDGAANEIQQPNDLAGLWLVIDFPFTTEAGFDRDGLNTFLKSIQRRFEEGNWTGELRESVAIPLGILDGAQGDDLVIIQGKQSQGRDISRFIDREGLYKLKYTLGISNPVALFHIRDE